MNELVVALNKGYVLKYNSTQPRYYKKIDGRLYFSETNGDYSKWKSSNAKDSVFNDITKWIIV